MELVQKLMKKTSKYIFYSPLTEKVLTECPCISVTCYSVTCMSVTCDMCSALCLLCVPVSAQTAPPTLPLLHL